MFKRKMGNRVAKSVVFLDTAVKVQRVYDSCCEIMVIISQLRCTLMGFKRDYRVKILSNQIKFYRPYSTYSSCLFNLKLRSRSFSTLKFIKS